MTRRLTQPRRFHTALVAALLAAAATDAVAQSPQGRRGQGAGEDPRTPRGPRRGADRDPALSRDDFRQRTTSPHSFGRRDPPGRKVTEYLEQQVDAASASGLTRIHVYDEGRLPAWSEEEWDALEWRAAQHTGPMEFRLCSAVWDRRSSEFENKGLVLGDPDGVPTVCFSNSPTLV